MFEGLANSGPLDMALRKIREREAPSDRCTQCTRCATWDSGPGFVCTEKVVSDEVLFGFPRKSWY
jgi:hypothetical protein